MTEKRRGMLWAAFTADTLSLGAHWVYNTRVIDKKFGRPENYEAPLTSYHNGKGKGDFTHYGDQTLLLLEALTAMPQFDVQGWADGWKTFFGSYGGYFDQATKTTLERMGAGEGPETSGSDSDDLAGAARIAPLIYAYGQEKEALDAAVKAATCLTHNNSQVIEAAVFIARAATHVLAGAAPLKACEDTLAADDYGESLTSAFEDGVDSRGGDTRQVIADFGQMCSVEAALPGVFHLMAKYENDLTEALVQNVMAGGDNAARGMLVATLLGAHEGMNGIPKTWLDELNAKVRIEAALAKIDAGS